MARYIRITKFLDPYAPEIDVPEGEIVAVVRILPNNVFDLLIKPAEAQE